MTTEAANLSQVLEIVDKKFQLDKSGEKVAGWLSMNTGKLIAEDDQEFCKIATPNDLRDFIRTQFTNLLEKMRWRGKQPRK